MGKSEDLTQQCLDNALVALDTQHPQMAQEKVSPIQKGISEEPQPFLLRSKLEPPPTPVHLVARPRLVHLLQTGATKPLTLVCAPAGFGKTTLVREWTVQRGCLYAWLTLDSDDNDPQRFLAYLNAALQQVQLRLDSALLARFTTPAHLALTEVFTGLLHELAVRPEEVTLIFENYHVIQNPLIHEALTFLFEHLPSHAHVLITSRNEFPCPLARLRVSGLLTELNTEALCFTREEIETLLVRNMHLDLGLAELATLEQRTEGWIAGLYLASLALKGQRDLAHSVATFTGRKRSILTYFLEEVLTPQTEPVRAFLLATSLLECLHDELCATVTGQEHAGRMLEYLERADLFLFPSEQQVGWYRYHPLLAEALRYHLERTQPEQVPILHLRASQWFEDRNMLEKALEHALAAHDHVRTVGLLERMSPTLLACGKVAILQQWLDALPVAVVRTSTRLCIMRAWLVFLASQPNEFLGWVEAAEHALHEQQEHLSSALVSELHAELVGLRTIYRVSYDDCAGAITACHQALQQLPPENLHPRAFLLMMLGFAYVRDKDVSAGVQAASQANSIFQVTGHALFLPSALLCQAEAYFAQGYPIQAAGLCRQVLTLAVGQNVPAVFASGVAHMCLGQVCWEWNNLEMAKSHLRRAWDLGMQTQTANTLFLAAWFLALVSQMQGETQQVDFWLRQGENIAQSSGRCEVIEQIALLRTQLFLAEGKVEDALLWMRERHAVLENLDHVRIELKYYIQVRVLLAASRTRTDGLHTQRALELLARLYMDAEGAGQVRWQLETLVLQALAFQLEDKNADALAVLERAIALAEPGRYIRLFVAEGEPMAKLLRQLLEKQRTQKTPSQALSLTYLAQLLKAFSPSPGTTLPTSPSPLAGEPVLDRTQKRSFL